MFKRSIHFFILLLISSCCLLSLSETQAQTTAALPSIECTKEFPCAQEMIPRINFWASVYYKHDESFAIFHDAKKPERVFSVIPTSKPCTRTRGQTENNEVEAERSRIKTVLETLAQKVETKNTSLTTDEAAVLDLYLNETPEKIRESASSVRCQTGTRNKFAKGIENYLRYKDMIVSILESEGLSSDLQYLPFVESSYNPKALSRVGAAGLWQIMPSTARRLGLKVDAILDERLDPEKATKAAAKYIRQSYNILSDHLTLNAQSEFTHQLGPFVVTSYNYGIGGAKKMLKDVGPNFLDVLRSYNGKKAGVAVQNFYASFLAAIYVGRNAKHFFDHSPNQTSNPFVMIQTQKATPADFVAKKLDISLTALEELNPALTHNVWEGKHVIPKDYMLRVPFPSPAQENTLRTLWKEPIPTLAMKSLPKKTMEAAPVLSPLSMSPVTLFEVTVNAVEGNPTYSLKVQEEETLGHYAEWLDLSSPKPIREINGLMNTPIALDQNLQLPITSEEQKLKFEQKRAEFHQTLEDEFLSQYKIEGQFSHTVKTGETQQKIADDYEVPLWLLRRINSNHSKLTVGQKINIPSLQTLKPIP